MAVLCLEARLETLGLVFESEPEETIGGMSKFSAERSGFGHGHETGEVT